MLTLLLSVRAMIWVDNDKLYTVITVVEEYVTRVDEGITHNKRYDNSVIF